MVILARQEGRRAGRQEFKAERLEGRKVKAGRLRQTARLNPGQR
jgi:hypothetical protein